MAVMRAAATTTAATSPVWRGFRALYSSISSFAFNQSQNKAEKPPAVEPSTNLFVSGLSKRTTSEGLRDAFAKFGEVVHGILFLALGRLVFYCLILNWYATIAEAESGIKGMDGQFLDGWVIFTEYARPRPPLPSPHGRH